MNRDPKDVFAWTPLQTQYAADVLKKHGMVRDLSTIVLIDEEGAHMHSTAVFRILQGTKLPWSVIGSTALITGPRFLFDTGYRFVGRNRSKISQCWPMKHRIEDYKDRMVGLDGRTVKEASADMPRS
mmetsp:Transcript_35992/g.84355  ORF Transcript_35992/g.84355 Transcript_35992/m.84355 type:complete len:127 (+) Transcript_35992:187-567(+)